MTPEIFPKDRDFHENRYNAIQSLRGIASLFVILEHIRFLNCGAFGVDIFFCISGFMMMLTTHKDTHFFFRKRLIRILPLYYMMTFLTWWALLLFPEMFEQTKAHPSLLIKSLLFIPFDIGGGVLQPLMRIGWTVNCEMFFYVLFFISLHISHKYRGLICSCFLAAGVVLNGVMTVPSVPLSFYGNPIMLEFILGILCYYAAGAIYRLHCHRHLGSFVLPLCAAAAVILFAALIWTKSGINILGLRRPLVWGIPGFLLTLCFFTIGLYIKLPKWSVSLGDMSFSVYLIHYYPVMLLDRLIFDFSAFSVNALAGAFAAAALSLLCSRISWYLVEKRLTGFLKSLLCRPRATP